MSDVDRPDLATHVTQITDPLLQMAKAKGDTGTMLVASLLDRVLADAGPRQAEVLRRCAIPHWIDPGVLGVLREREDGNERVLEKLSGYSFVRPVGPDRYGYHDQVRQALLDEWHAKEPEQLRALHEKLYSYFDTLCRTVGVQVPLDESTLAEQPREMLAMGTWDLWRREAIYHLLCADSQRGLRELQQEFNALLNGHWLADAEALLQMTEEVKLDAKGRRLVQYLSARLAQGALRLDHAETQLKALLDDASVDGELRAQVEQTLGEICAETGQSARASELYRSSLAYWQERERGETDQAAQQQARRAVANVMLLLGEAYFGLASNTGGWYISATSPSPFIQTLMNAWEWLLGMPFIVIGWFLRPTRWRLPQPYYCAQYQNWLLIRLYRTAQEWFSAAADAFQSLGDQEGLLRANQQLARILMVYGYTDEAIKRFQELLTWPQAQQPYVRSWLERFLAEALVVKGDTAQASRLLAQGLKVFRTVGDGRREAAVLALGGRVAAEAGATDEALRSYSTSLDRFRAMQYPPARELILHDLRSWGRRSGDPVLRQQIGRVIADEPEKRYMARFPRALLPLLQGASLLALPLALLLLAYVAPTAAVRVLAGDQPLSIGVVFDPVRALGVGLVLLPLYLASYAFLAMTVISFLPISRIEREQPDYLVTSRDGISLFDRTGGLEQYMGWSAVRRKFSLDRCIWTRPLPLYSRTFLEDQFGNDLRIDGITGWYVSLITDIDQHLAQLPSGKAVEQRNLGYALLRSRSGVSCVLAVLFLLIYAGAENGYSWLPLLRALPPFLYAAFGMLTLSGVLFLVPLAYWLAHRPLKLQRALNLSSRWPLLVIVVGALPILSFFMSTISGLVSLSMRYETFNTLLDLLNEVTLIPILTYSTLLWGIYMVVEGVCALLLAERPGLRRIIVNGTLVLGIALLLPLFVPLFFDQWASVATRRAALLSDERAGAQDIDAAADMALQVSSQAYSLNGDPINLINQGSAQFYAQRYDEALELYTRAIEIAPPNSTKQALAYFNRSQVQLKRDDPASAQSDLEQAKAICAQPDLSSNPACQQISAWQESPMRPLPAPGAAPDDTPSDTGDDNN